MSQGASPRPRHLAHRGSVIATGFAIDAGLLGVREAQRRVLALWAPGAVVFEADGLLVIDGLRATRVRAELAPGAPVVVERGLASSAPLDLDEAEALRASAPARAVVIVRAGVAALAIPDEAHRVDVATWIDLGALEILTSAPLADPAPSARAPAVPAPAAREVFGIGAAPPQAAAAREALARALRGEPVDRTGDGDAAQVGEAAIARVRRPSLWQRLRRAVAARLGAAIERRAAAARARSSTGAVSVSGVAAPARPAPAAPRARPSWWRRLFGGRGSTQAAPGRPGAPPPAGDAPLAPSTPPPPSWMQRLRDRLAEALWKSRLGSALGRRHAEYLRHMLELFDKGDLDEALRHAIPLGGESDEAGGLAFGVPRPRDEVKLSMHPPLARSSSIPVAGQTPDLIRARYKAALARLEQLGRIEDAAYVLAELLGDVVGAIALLERHQRYALAARLAEGRKLEPALVVRLWFLAGDRERAVEVARRHAAWAAAIAQLERDGAARAASLRLLWADHLADAGDYVQAVDVAWPVPDARALAMTWIDRGIAAGGSAAARLLARKLAHEPASYPAVAPAMFAILDDPDDDASWRRVALGEALVTGPATSEIRTIARAAVRAMVRDLGHGADGETPALLPRLMRLADDAALRADQPVIPAGLRPPSLVDRGELLVRHWPGGDAGTVAVHDAAFLPGGRVLIALGELGVRLVGRDGRVVAHFDQPATSLVVSDHGTRAIALCPRGELKRLARLDLVAGSGRWWCDASVDQWAPTFDGSAWWVTRGKELLAIDPTGSRWRAIWGVDTGQGLGALARDGQHVAVHGDAELWCYEGFTLRARKPHAPIADDEPTVFTRHAPRPSTQDALRVISLPHGSVGGWPAAVRGPDGEVPLTAGMPIGIEAYHRFAAVAQRLDDAIAVTAIYLPKRMVIARLVFDGATRASLRVADLALTVGDDRGRVVVVDLRSGTVRRDLRIGP